MKSVVEHLSSITAFTKSIVVNFLLNNCRRGDVVEWLEQLGYGTESRRIA